MASFGALSNAGLSPAYDVEDLVFIGRKVSQITITEVIIFELKKLCPLTDVFFILQHKACPYYVTRFLLQNADIIFCPYNYMIDPNIRKSVSCGILQ